MPIFEYLCRNNHITDDIRSIKDRNKPIKCETCNKPAKIMLSSFTARVSDKNAQGKYTIEGLKRLNKITGG